MSSLKTYNSKRHFNRTSEPRGKSARKAASHKNRAMVFVIQKHDASHLHYDFRLEIDGVLKSWAVPKGPSLDPARKALAVQVEDHPLEYGRFEGVIPQGEYGGGTVLLWDTGTWKPLHDAAAGYENGKLHFELHGHKLHGEWSLVRMHGKSGGDGKNWLLMKLPDRFADKQRDVLKDDSSVKSQRSLPDIAEQRDHVWNGSAKKTAALAGAKPAGLPADFSPQLAVLADRPPAGAGWIHEIKFDGYRFLCRLKSGKARLITRNGKDWTDKFPALVAELQKLPVDSAVLDGEVVVLDKHGRSDFQALQASIKARSAEPIYCVFDLPFSQGNDLRAVRLLERKRELARLLKDWPKTSQVRLSEHVDHADGIAVIQKACKMDLEGIISKRADSPYVSRRDPSWVKSKCDHRQEMVIIGFTPPGGTRKGFGALLLGYYDDEGKLVYAGRVGTGFDDRLLTDSLKKLQAIEVDQPATAVLPPARERANAHWVNPQLVAEIKFTAWTRDGALRHPVFVGFRLDKPAKEVVREDAISLKKAAAGTGRKALVKTKKQSANQKPAAAKAKSEQATSRTSKLRTKAAASPSAAVNITHPDKLLYPQAKVTKQDLADYYTTAARWMLPHLIHRPLTLLRCPGGVGSKCFYQRNWTDQMPANLDKVEVGESRQHETHMAVHDLNGLLSLAQLGVLEIHCWNCHTTDVEAPDQLVFDLDPDEGLAWKKVVDAARILRSTLDELKLPAFLKTSGGKGLHLTVPVKTDIDWDSAKSFSETIAKSLAEKHPDLFVANMRKDLRKGKIYIDYNRNGRSATAVAPYSTRAKSGASIAMPISWEELGKLTSADHFTVGTADQYLKKRKKDPWLAFDSSRADLRSLIR